MSLLCLHANSSLCTPGVNIHIVRANVQLQVMLACSSTVSSSPASAACTLTRHPPTCFSC